MKAAFLSIVISISAVSHTYAGEALKYEPAVVTLTGTLTLENFPGPPEYTSIARGDEIRRFWILNLDHPIKVVADPGEELFETHDQVRKLQLVCSEGCRKQLHPKKGQKIKLMGTLYSRHTAHHYTDVLMTVQKKVK